jgi:Undecaprenyl-phosphate galactose phosphotransferase WbaP
LAQTLKERCSVVADTSIYERGTAEQRSTAAQLRLVPERHEQLRAASAGLRKTGWKRRLVPAALVLADILVALLSWGVASVLQSIWGQGALWEMTAVAMVSVMIVWVGLRGLLGLYPGYGLDSPEQLRRHTYASFAALAMVAIFALGFQVGHLLSRPLLALAFIGLLILAPFVQHVVKLWMKKRNWWGRPVIVLGYKEAGAKVVTLLKEEWELGYDPVAIFDYRLDTTGEVLEGGDNRQVLAAVVDTASEHGVDTAIFAMPNIRREQLSRLVNLASLRFRQVVVIPNLDGITNSAVVARDFAGTFGVEIKYNLLDPWARRVKRALDLVGSVMGGLLISPVFVAIVVLIKLGSPGPAFYGHWRVGIGGRHFRCWKFRTMQLNAEQLLEEYLQTNLDLRAEWEENQKLQDDPRVTRAGRFLRKTSLDELPQLWNVLRGEMSLTGPRPIVDAEVPKYGNVYELYKRIRPGMSGFWQVSGRSDTSYVERVAMDSHYVRNWSVWLDLIILTRTVKIVLLGRGAR